MLTPVKPKKEPVAPGAPRKARHPKQEAEDEPQPESDHEETKQEAPQPDSEDEAAAPATPAKKATAAKAPGDNRIAQAQQIAAIIIQTREIHELVETAKQETEAKFETARQMFEKSRAELAALHTQ